MIKEHSLTESRQRGAALLVVLAAGAVLAMLALLILNGGRRMAIEDIAAENAARAEAAVEAGFAFAIAGLSAPDVSARWAIGGEERTLSIDGFLVTAHIEDELGKIDLNAADVTLLARLFAVAEATDAEARELAAAIDARRRPQADRAEALSGSPTGPFLRVDELLLLPGVSETLYARIASAVTVYSHRPIADLESATALVLMAMQGLDARAAETAVATRPPRALVQRQGRPLTIDVRVKRDGYVEEWDGEVSTPIESLHFRNASHRTSGGGAQRRTVILTGEMERPYLIIGAE